MSAPARLAAPLPPMALGASWSQVFELYGQDESDPRTPAGIRLHLARRDRRPLTADEIIVLSSDNGAVVIDGNRFTVSRTPAQTADYAPGLYEFQLVEIEGAAQWVRLVGVISLEAGPVLAEAGDLTGPPLTGATAGQGAVALYLSETIRVAIGPGDTPGLVSRVSAEEVTRAAADASLTTRLSAEEITRASADASLTTRLSTEEAARISGDASLTSRISTEEVARASADTSLTTRISTEEATRAAGDASLTSRLSTEETTRSAADTSLSSRVGAIETGYLPLSGGVLTGALRVVAGVALAVGLAVGADAGTGLYSPASQQVGIAAGGTHVATFEAGIATVAGVVRPDADATRDLGTTSARWRDGFLSRNLTVGTGVSAGTYLRVNGTNAGYIALGTADDVILVRDGAANTLALRNGANAQTFRAYETYTDASNYARFGVQLSGSTWSIGPEAAGTGSSARAVTILCGGNLTLYGGGSAQWQISGGNFLAVADNTRDIGAVGANRPRNLFLGGTITTGGSITSGTSIVATTSITAGASNSINWSGRSVMSSTADGRIMLTNAAGDSFSRVMLGGSTNLFPAIGRVSTNIVVTLGDGTMGAGLVAAFVQTPASTVAGLPAAATAGAGARAFVTDANATTFLSVVAGGGANAVPVVSNGTNWLIG